MNTSVYIIGAGGHSKQVIDIFLENGREIAGVFDDHKIGPFYRGTRIIGTSRDAAKYANANGDGSFFCAIGDNDQRKRVTEELVDWVHDWTNCISKTAYVSPSVRMGRGNYIGNHGKVLADSAIGDFNIVNEGATLTHDNLIGDYNHVAPNASLGGRVKLGNSNLIGTNATINPDVHLGDGFTIGSGSVVLRSLQNPGTYVGAPCRRIPIL